MKIKMPKHIGKQLPEVGDLILKPQYSTSLYLVTAVATHDGEDWFDWQLIHLPSGETWSTVKHESAKELMEYIASSNPIIIPSNQVTITVEGAE